MEETLSASEFKAKCLDILKRLGEHRLSRVTVTRRGKPVAVVTPLQPDEGWILDLQREMKGSVTVPDGLDLTAPILDEPLDAERGIIHR